MFSDFEKRKERVENFKPLLVFGNGVGLRIDMVQGRAKPILMIVDKDGTSRIVANFRTFECAEFSREQILEFLDLKEEEENEGL